MKKYISLILISVFLLLSLSSCGKKVERKEVRLREDTSFGLDVKQLAVEGEQDKVDNLRINYEPAPNCVGEHPVFSWNPISSVRGARQTAYRVRVAESEEALTGGSLVWDSGTVGSDECVGIVCGMLCYSVRAFVTK